ncbi:MAG: TIGR04255 family protein [Rhodopirellula sp. JB044]|uniref:TIGR04255 family protein n=1 Tax=Rhodopirellula sp. JB044 TaxID=3342844 RepID=UPI00370A1B73
MLFPDSPRVLYGKNPLVQVIMQIRFPQILRIASDLPADFQDRIRDDYPLYREKREASIGLPAGLEKLLPSEALPKSDVAYEFSSDDGNWTLSLTSGFLALSCRCYERWEGFSERLEPGMTALRDIYKPQFFTRLGLRYQNLITRSALEIDGTDWKELLEPHISGEMATEIAPQIAHIAREMRVESDDGTKVQVRHGFVPRTDGDEICYSIDADFFTDSRLTNDQISPTLDNYHIEAGRLFRWCISERLHTAMDPQAI